MAVEVRRIARDGALHDRCPAGALAVVRRQHLLLELGIQGSRIAGIVGVILAADGPAGDAFDPALDPPSVEDTQIRYAVERRLHSARARGFERTLRGVEPDVTAGNEEPCKVHVVVREEHDRYGA